MNENPIYKRPWFIALISFLVIAAGFVALFLFLQSRDQAGGADVLMTAGAALSVQSKFYLFLYCVGVCLIAYLVAQFGFDKSISVTMNTFDSILLLVIGISLVVALFGYEAADGVNDVVKWSLGVAIGCGVVTLVLSVVANLPNSLYIFIAILAKLFLLVAIVAVILITIIVIILAIVAAAMNKEDEKWEIVGYSSYYDAFIVKRVR
jgi:hypothetical protein